MPVCSEIVTADSTIRGALQWAKHLLCHADTPDLDAQVLLTHILGVDRSFLFAHGEHELDDAQTQVYQRLVSRRAAGEPIAYLVGKVGFYDLELMVTPAVLIPRPETELLLEAALHATRDGQSVTAVDIGTGSGALALTFARHRPHATVYASETSDDALAVARSNAESTGVRLTFFQGDLAAP